MIAEAFQAARNCELDKLKNCLADGTKLEIIPDDEDNHVLTVAVIHQFLLGVELLLNSGMDVNLPNSDGSTALTHCRGPILDCLIKFGATPVMERPEDGITSIFRFVESEDIESLRKVLETVPNFDLPELLERRDEINRTALQRAVSVSNIDAAKLLLKKGAKIGRYRESRPALNHLVIAIRRCSIPMIRLLLDSGAELGGDYEAYLLEAQANCAEAVKVLESYK